MKTKSVQSVAATAVAAIAVAGLATAGDYSKKKDEGAKAASSQMTIFETAKAGGFTTLVAAVEAAGLQDALSGEGPLTVFAPTD